MLKFRLKSATVALFLLIWLRSRQKGFNPFSSIRLSNQTYAQIQNYSRSKKVNPLLGVEKTKSVITDFISDQITQRSSCSFIKTCLKIFHEKLMP